MLIADLLEELQKHGEENIEFGFIDKSKIDSDLDIIDGSTEKLQIMKIDGRFIFKILDANMKPTNTVHISLTNFNAQTK